MAKVKTIYVCKECGATSLKWSGRCFECGEWDSMVETAVKHEKERRPHREIGPSSEPKPLPHISADGFERIPVPIEEMSRVLGGGIVPGSIVLIGGEPGIGKSTLLLQLSSLIAQDAACALFISGEESIWQVKMLAERLGIKNEQLYILSEISLNRIIEHIERLNPRLAVVDSIQSVHLEELPSAAGSVSQVRECAAALSRLAKATGIPIFLIGHITKAGAIAGPKVLEHIVDAVLYLEGDRFHTYRLLRSVKNRFGATNEVGVFEMRSEGLVEVKNPSEAFLAERLPNAAGSAIAITMEGTRPLLVEIQALSSTTSFGLPRRTANGVDFNRLLLLVAVLTKRVGLRLFDQDIFVNVVGGLRVSEPAADLAIAVAIASSFKNNPVAADLAIVGEVGLSGELRAVGQLERRLKEAAKLGFRRCLVPKPIRRREISYEKMEVMGVRSVGEAIEIALKR
jgi:DNA repair protein RadA/Sms